MRLTNKLFVNDKTTASSPTNIPPKHHIKCYNNEKELLKNLLD